MDNDTQHQAQLGDHSCRFLPTFGLSLPHSFCIGSVGEAIELYDRVVAVDNIFEDGEAIAAKLTLDIKLRLLMFAGKVDH